METRDPKDLPVRRKDGKAKATGRAQYVDDVVFPGMLYGATIRSSIPRGRILGITFEGDIPWNQFTIVTAKDLPGKNAIAHILMDQPCLAGEIINHPEEAVVLLAHPDRHLLQKARQHVRIHTESLPAIFTIEDSLAKKAVIWGKDNLFKSFCIEKGDVDSAWSAADHIIEGEYRTGAQEQLYIETNGMISTASSDGVTVWGSMQCPYYVHHALCSLFELPADKVRVIQTETGGGFGGKEDYPSILACHTALLSWKSGKPVKIIYDRAEDMAATTKRHPSRTKHRTAVTRDGKLLAMDIDFALDGGAYATLSSVVLSRGSIHAAGCYSCPNVRIRSRAVATNAPPHGAFRGFGAPQSLFALEAHLDRVAAVVGLSPEEFRRRNFLKVGDTTATGQVIREEPELDVLMSRALQELDYARKRELAAEHNRNPKSRTRKGVGFATFMHGAGFTGSGEKFLASTAAVEASPFGRVKVLASSTEIGQGARTVFAQIVSAALGIPYDDVDIETPDTHLVPNSGPTVASRTTMVVGKLVENAALGLKKKLIATGHLDPACPPERYPEAFKEACTAYTQKHGRLWCSSQYEQPGHIQWSDESYKGDAYGTFAWAAYAAEVTVDLTTYEVKVDHFVAAQEIGKVMHPTLAEGQIEGGVVQGLGYALYEQVQMPNGRMVNNTMTNYIIPTSADVPPIRVLFAENPYAFGPQGAKGIGELPLDGVAPAILNAVASALGKPLSEIPLLPETIMTSVEGSG